jgi:hypothetical protein
MRLILETRISLMLLLCIVWLPDAVQAQTLLDYGLEIGGTGT